MSKWELIELKDLTPNDRIELAAPPVPLPGHVRGTERPSQYREAVLVGSSLRVEEPSWYTGEAGEGHDFQPCSHTQLTWCDLCGDFIWGLYKQSLRCANCGFTCHHRCQNLIQLDCRKDSFPKDPPDLSEDTIETDTNVILWPKEGQMELPPPAASQADSVLQLDSFNSSSSTSSGYCSQDDLEWDQFFTACTSLFGKAKRLTDEQIDWGKQVLSVAEIQQKVKEYNAQIDRNLYMVINRDGSYTGFIRVLFKLTRPVSLPPPRKLSTTLDIGEQESLVKRWTSFYLPKDTAKHLHISSHTMAREVIQALLNKFTVVDNPAKFALFERSERHNQIYLRKLSDDECPLHLRLCAGPSEKVLSLVLKENETGDVNWDAFSLPELCNFLRILKREEEEHVRQIVKRYAVARDKMKQEMASVTNTV